MGKCKVKNKDIILKYKPEPIIKEIYSFDGWKGYEVYLEMDLDYDEDKLICEYYQKSKIKNQKLISPN